MPGVFGGNVRRFDRINLEPKTAADDPAVAACLALVLACCFVWVLKTFLATSAAYQRELAAKEASAAAKKDE